jgi:hypothetical protein
MSNEAYVESILRVLGANVGIVLLVFGGIVVGCNFSGFPLVLFIFIIALLQGGMMVTAFNPTVGSSGRLTIADKVIGGIGLAAWMVVHLINSAIIIQHSLMVVLSTACVEVLLYGAVYAVFLKLFNVTSVRRASTAHKAVDIGGSMPSPASPFDNLEVTRREDALIACELLYALREPDIGDRYPRERFQEFVSNFLSDGKPVDVVERRAVELQLLIQQHYEAVNPPGQFRDLAELTTWYEKQLTLIENLGIADIYKRDYKVQLNERYSDLTARLLESLEP